jgi:hypothetical protein
LQSTGLVATVAESLGGLTRMNEGNVALLCVGIVCSVASGCLFIHSWRRRRSWVSGEGVIVGYREDSDAIASLPEVQFRLPNGKEYTFVSACSGSPEKSPAGSRVRVLYAPESPSNAEVWSFSNLWALPIALLGFGLVFILAGILI